MVARPLPQSVLERTRTDTPASQTASGMVGNEWLMRPTERPSSIGRLTVSALLRQETAAGVRGLLGQVILVYVATSLRVA